MTQHKTREYHDISNILREKQFIEEKLRQSNTNVDRLQSILAKKGLKKLESEDIEDKTITKYSHPVSAFKIPPNPVKAAPKEIVMRNPAPKPSLISGEKALELRYKTLMSKKNKEIQRIQREDEEMERITEERKAAKRVIPPKIQRSLLPNRYIRGELPCTIEHGGNGQFLSWMAPFESLDYGYYLPLFFDGLQCKDHPHSFLARQGVSDLLYATRGNPQRVISCLKDLVRPLRNALSMNNADITLAVMKIIQQLIRVDESIGPALLPYGRQFLVPLVPFLDRTKNLGDGIDYGQRKRDDVGEEVSDRNYKP
jgi:hypothetical protein